MAFVISTARHALRPNPCPWARSFPPLPSLATSAHLHPALLHPPPFASTKALAVLYNATFDLQRAATWKTDWVAFLWLRNMALGLFFYGGWHVFLYEIPKIREKV